MRNVNRGKRVREGRDARARTATDGEVRIIAGQWRSRRIAFPGMQGLRPTPDRVRETLFNWLGQSLEGKRCLDLFAGSGALGFEALSRGAARTVMVERDRTVARALIANAEKLEPAILEHRLRIVNSDALEFLSNARPIELERFDVVFLDPPFDLGVSEQTVEVLPGALSEGSLVYLESGRDIVWKHPWRRIKSARAGKVHYQLMQWGSA